MAGVTAEYKCKCCKLPFTARVADRNRGWARFCSKRCKAIKQEQRTGQNAAHKHAVRCAPFIREFGGNPQFHPRTGEYQGFTLDADGLEWDGHKSEDR